MTSGKIAEELKNKFDSLEKNFDEVLNLLCEYEEMDILDINDIQDAWELDPIRGNALRHILQATGKDRLVDLNKALDYLQRVVQQEESELAESSERPVKIKKLNKLAVLPEYKTPGASGLDLCALHGGVIEPGDRAIISTGIAIELPEGFEGQIRPRSGLSRIGVDIAFGTIDSDYRGEIKVCLSSSVSFMWGPGERLAQLVIAPVARCELVEVEELGDTARGDSGFGSTGR